MKRWLPRMLIAGLLLLGCGLLALWFRSYRSVDSLWQTHVTPAGTSSPFVASERYLMSVRGRVGLCIQTYTVTQKAPRLVKLFEEKMLAGFHSAAQPLPQRDLPIERGGTTWNYIGFRLFDRASSDDSVHARVRVYVAPHWFLASLAWTLPAILTTRRC